MKFVPACLLVATLVVGNAARAASASTTLGVGLTIVASCGASGCRTASTPASRSRLRAPFYKTIRSPTSTSPASVTTTY